MEDRTAEMPRWMQEALRSRIEKLFGAKEYVVVKFWENLYDPRYYAQVRFRLKDDPDGVLDRYSILRKSENDT